MNKAELLAGYRHYGEDLVSIESKEFFDVLHNNTVSNISSKIDSDTDCTTFSVDGWDYYCYYSWYKVNGSSCSDLFVFKIKTLTESDRESFKKIFSKENNFVEFNDNIDEFVSL